MRKLEEIMSAEESARHAVASARERAAGLVRDAENQARQIATAAREQSATETAAVRLELLGAAQRQAQSETEEAFERLAREMDGSRARMSAAVEAVLERLQG